MRRSGQALVLHSSQSVLYATSAQLNAQSGMLTQLRALP
jgi:hypothetical protein